MDESATKAIKGMELNGSDADSRKTSVTMMVSGYDTSLPDDDIKSLLSEHFSSCGEITNVYISTRVRIKIRNKYAFVDITGEDAEEKALQLNGSDFGGRKLVVKVKPPSTKIWNVTPELAAIRAEHNEEIRRTFTVIVSGYDTLAPEEDNKNALIKHFSSCGEIQSVFGLRDIGRGPNDEAALHIMGDGVEEKARALSGCDMGGWKANVVSCYAWEEIKHTRVYGVTRPENLGKKAKVARE